MKRMDRQHQKMDNNSPDQARTVRCHKMMMTEPESCICGAPKAGYCGPLRFTRRLEFEEALMVLESAGNPGPLLAFKQPSTTPSCLS